MSDGNGVELAALHDSIIAAREQLDRLQLLGTIDDLKCQLEKLQLDMARVQRSNTGLASEVQIVRMKNQNLQHQLNQALGIIANAQMYIEDNTIEPLEIIKILSKRIEALTT